MKVNLIIASALFSLTAVADVSNDLKFLNNEVEPMSKVTVEELQEASNVVNKQMSKSFTVKAADAEKLRTLQKKVMFSNLDYDTRLEKTLLLNLRKALETGNFQALKSDLTPDLKIQELKGAIDSSKFSQLDGISFANAAKFSSANSPKSELIKNFSAYLQDFSKVEFVEIKVLDSVPVDAKTNSEKAVAQDSLYSAEPLIKTTANLEVRGLQKNNKPRVDKFIIQLYVKNESNTSKISALEFVSMQSLRLIDREPAFKQVASNAGFDSGETFARLEALRRGGYGFAIEDFNNDGHLDAFVGNYGSSTLWLGNKDGQFKEIKMADVNKLNLAKAAAFVDLDNDNWKDLLVTRFASDNLVGDVFVYRNENGTFKEVKNAFPSNILRDYAMPMAVADYNNDGLLDIYIGFPGERDFSAGMGDGKKLLSSGLYVNNGGFKFTDKTKEHLADSFKANLYPHGALATDFNMDGAIDILVMDDQMNVSPLYKNAGNGVFTQANTSYRMTNVGYGMGVAGGDFNQDGLQDYIVSNATFNDQMRLNRYSQGKRGNYNLSKTLDNQAVGIRMFINEKNAGFKEKQSAIFADSGEAAGGATVIDYDNDGLLDIYLVNGLWSGSSREETIDSLFAKATQMRVVNQNHLHDGLGDRSPEGSKSIFMKVLMNDRVGEGKEQKTLSFAGHQRNRLFKNIGNGEFIEVGYLEGVDSISDGYMSVVADLNKDGRADLLLRNCDPGAADNTFAPIQVYQNNHKSGKAAWISLKGKKSNSMGVGAKLYATIGKKTHYREITANNSAVQGEVVAQFGFGKHDVITKLKIQWPSGTVETYKNIKAGHHKFEEPMNALVSAD